MHLYELIWFYLHIVLMLNLPVVMAAAVVEDSVVDLFMAADIHPVMDHLIMKSKSRQFWNVFTSLLGVSDERWLWSIRIYHLSGHNWYLDDRKLSDYRIKMNQSCCIGYDLINFCFFIFIHKIVAMDHHEIQNIAWLSKILAAV